jgi:dolichyl-phosphate beta-glucosyltransferase
VSVPTNIVLVIPCYNEEKRMPLAEFQDFFAQPAGVHVLFVNDGSSDATGKLIDGLRQKFPDRVRCLHLEHNVGKAEAVRQGIIEAVKTEKCLYVGYFDADLATPLSEVSRLLEAAEKKGASMAFGARVKRLGIRLDRSGLRHYVGRMFATEASMLLGLPVYDTQCGAKLFKGTLAKEVFKEAFLSRWFFDVEIFFRLIALFGRDRVGREVIEIPFDSWIEKGSTKVGWTDFIKAPFELLRIYWYYR